MTQQQKNLQYAILNKHISKDLQEKILRSFDEYVDSKFKNDTRLQELVLEEFVSEINKKKLENEFSELKASVDLVSIKRYIDEHKTNKDIN